MNSGYKIDGYDILGTWNINVKSVTGLHSFLNRKGEISQSWPDSDGEEPFTLSNDIYFEGRDIFLYCYIKDTAFAYINAKLILFKHLMESPGMHILQVPYLNAYYNLMYVKGSDLTMLTSKRHTNYVVAEFWVQFRETTPYRN